MGLIGLAVLFKGKDSLLRLFLKISCFSLALRKSIYFDSSALIAFSSFLMDYLIILSYSLSLDSYSIFRLGEFLQELGFEPDILLAGLPLFSGISCAILITFPFSLLITPSISFGMKATICLISLTIFCCSSFNCLTYRFNMAQDEQICYNLLLFLQSFSE